MPNFVQIRAEMADLFTFFEICMALYGSDIYKDCPKKSTSGVGILTPSQTEPNRPQQLGLWRTPLFALNNPLDSFFSDYLETHSLHFKAGLEKLCNGTVPMCVTRSDPGHGTWMIEKVVGWHLNQFHITKGTASEMA